MKVDLKEHVFGQIRLLGGMREDEFKTEEERQLAFALAIEKRVEISDHSMTGKRWFFETGTVDV